jgi:hypothetical protein
MVHVLSVAWRKLIACGSPQWRTIAQPRQMLRLMHGPSRVAERAAKTPPPTAIAPNTDNRAVL